MGALLSRTGTCGHCGGPALWPVERLAVVVVALSALAVASSEVLAVFAWRFLFLLMEPVPAPIGCVPRSLSGPEHAVRDVALLTWYLAGTGAIGAALGWFARARANAAVLSSGSGRPPRGRIAPLVLLPRGLSEVWAASSPDGGPGTERRPWRVRVWWTAQLASTATFVLIMLVDSDVIAVDGAWRTTVVGQLVMSVLAGLLALTSLVAAVAFAATVVRISHWQTAAR